MYNTHYQPVETGIPQNVTILSDAVKTGLDFTLEKYLFRHYTVDAEGVARCQMQLTDEALSHGINFETLIFYGYLSREELDTASITQKPTQSIFESYNPLLLAASAVIASIALFISTQPSYERYPGRFS